MTTVDNTVAGAHPVPALSISIEQVNIVEFAAVPTLRFSARIDSAGAETISSVALATQLRIAAGRRFYDGREQDRLLELFGPPGGWGRSVRSLLWTHATTQVAAFSGGTVADIMVTCTYDFDVASAKYFHALDDGEVPLEFLFSGTIFYSANGLLRIAQIPWDTEAEYRMPVRVWRQMMEHYFPRSAWLRLDRDTFDQLYAYKARHTLTSWSDAVAALLRGSERRTVDG